MALLEIRNATVQFGGITAVNDASMQVDGGTITGLIGPNGAGKTTLFNVITGLQPPTRGTIVFRDQDVTKAPPNFRAKLGMGRTFQRLEAFGSLTIRENVQVAREIKGGARTWLRTPQGPHGRPAASTASGCASTPSSAPTRSRPAWLGCWRSPARWPSSRPCSCSTSRPPAWTRPRPRGSASCSRRWPAKAPRS